MSSAGPRRGVDAGARTSRARPSVARVARATSSNPGQVRQRSRRRPAPRRAADAHRHGQPHEHGSLGDGARGVRDRLAAVTWTTATADAVRISIGSKPSQGGT